METQNFLSQSVEASAQGSKLPNLCIHPQRFFTVADRLVTEKSEAGRTLCPSIYVSFVFPWCQPLLNWENPKKFL